MKTKSIFLALVILMISSCSKNKTYQETHQGQISRTEKHDNSSTNIESSLDIQDQIKSYQFILNQKDNQNFKRLYKDVYLPLSKKILSFENLSSPEVFKHSENYEYLKIFNDTILKLDMIQKSQEENDTMSSIFESYWDIASMGCTTDLHQCRNLTFLGHSSLSAEVLKQYALLLDRRIKKNNDNQQRIDLIKKKFSILWIGHYLGMGFKKLEILLLSSRNEINEIKSHVPDVMYRSFENLYENILIHLNEKAQENPEIKLQLATISGKQDILNHFSLLDPKMISQNYGSIGAAKVIFLNTCQSMSLENDLFNNSDINKTINHFLTKPEFIKILSNFKINADLLHGISFSKESNPAKTLFLLDKYFQGHYDREIVENCFDFGQMNDQDKSSFLILVKRYIQIQIILGSIQTSEHMANVYFPVSIQEDSQMHNNLSKSKRPELVGEQLISAPINEAGLLKKSIWDPLIQNKSKRILNLIKANLGHLEETNNLQYIELENLLGNIEHNVNLMVDYPQKLMLAAILGRNNFQIQIASEATGGSVEKNSAEYITKLLQNSEEDIILNFSGDWEQLHTSELSLGFSYLLSTEVFSIYQKQFERYKEDGGLKARIDHSFDNPFKAIFDKYFIEDIKIFEEFHKKIKEKTSNPLFKDDLNTCSILLEGKKSKRSKTFQSLNNSAGLSFNQNGIGGHLFEIYQLSKSSDNKNNFFNEVLDHINGALYSKLALMKRFENTYDQYIHQTLNADLFKNQYSYELRKNTKYGQVLDLIFSTTNLALEHSELIPKCIYKMHQKEKQMRINVYEQESLFLGRLYDAYSFLINNSTEGQFEKSSNLLRCFNAALNSTMTKDESCQEFEDILGPLNEISFAYMDRSVTRSENQFFDILDLSGTLRLSAWNLWMRWSHYITNQDEMIRYDYPRNNDYENTSHYAKGRSLTISITPSQFQAMKKNEFILEMLKRYEQSRFVHWWQPTLYSESESGLKNYYVEFNRFMTIVANSAKIYKTVHILYPHLLSKLYSKIDINFVLDTYTNYMTMADIDHHSNLIQLDQFPSSINLINIIPSRSMFQIESMKKIIEDNNDPMSFFSFFFRMFHHEMLKTSYSQSNITGNRALDSTGDLFEKLNSFQQISGHEKLDFQERSSLHYLFNSSTDGFFNDLISQAVEEYTSYIKSIDRIEEHMFKYICQKINLSKKSGSKDPFNITYTFLDEKNGKRIMDGNWVNPEIDPYIEFVLLEEYEAEIEQLQKQIPQHFHVKRTILNLSRFKEKGGPDAWCIPAY